MKSLVSAVLVPLILFQSAAADDNSAMELLKVKLDAVIKIVQDNDLVKQKKNSEIINIVSPIFNFSLMAKLSLGKKYWPNLTIEQKEKFTGLFIKLLKKAYLKKLTLYTDEKIVFKAPVLSGKKVHIPTEVISKDSRRTSMLYKLYKSKQGWQIYDMEIEGVSIISSYRSQFAHVLRNRNMDDLLQMIEEKTKK
jgi:phospholipid transport system substrate-binding protein